MKRANGVLVLYMIYDNLGFIHTRGSRYDLSVL